MKQDTVQLLGLRWLSRNGPWLVLDDVFVNTRNQFPDVFQTARKAVVVKVSAVALNDTAGQFAYFVVALRLAWRGNAAAAVLGNHGRRPAEEVSKIIRKVAIGSLDDGIKAEITILAEDHLAQQVVAQKLGAEDLDQDIRT